jgi:eukaryotic translation initiation factor 2C
MVEDLEEMMLELLNDYEAKCGELPKRVVVYRDGVSDGQFQYVLNEELVLLQKSFKKKSPKYEPKLTFLVVQKRHHTRLRSLDPKQVVGRHRNVPPGTLVDRDITHKTDFDFFLCSHEGIQGTSRPSHYHVLYNTNVLSADDLHAMTYYLCHVYARASRSVSIPAPVYYADLAAYRGRNWVIEDEDIKSQFDTQSSTGREPTRDQEEALFQAKREEFHGKMRVSANLRTRMFYV